MNLIIFITNTDKKPNTLSIDSDISLNESNHFFHQYWQNLDVDFLNIHIFCFTMISHG